MTEAESSSRSIQALWEQAKKKIKPRAVDLYDVFCAVAYAL